MGAKERIFSPVIHNNTFEDPYRKITSSATWRGASPSDSSRTWCIRYAEVVNQAPCGTLPKSQVFYVYDEASKGKIMNRTLRHRKHLPYRNGSCSVSCIPIKVRSVPTSGYLRRYSLWVIHPTLSSSASANRSSHRRTSSRNW